ncbi:MAG TPA: putative sugar nucleotidyl transferase [bacterium]|uniref:Bifunctional protein GlmU n=1 Tax=candidate division TA06 bacterium ADurb.Bin417 TaxID=1852828 RepID=A0A1V5MHH8_UNCT6|nr:MAG: Bifunctional protein GlmU [candidate division TA06 bacterium ADurb.Bin417]HNQ35450.1 putative sugar nucleotidyl transferase [bacterium]HNS48840.1 putative sugar nucleotidyl transferase [bacterium]
MRTIIFEDDGFQALYPLTYLRPVFGLRCGATTLYEKIRRHFGAGLPAAALRPGLAALWRREHPGAGTIETDAPFQAGPEPMLLVNGRWLAEPPGIPATGPEEAAFAGGDLAYLRLRPETAAALPAQTWNGFLAAAVEKLPRREVELKLIRHPWDLINHNPDAIRTDFQLAGKSGLEGEFHPQSVIFGDPGRVYLAAGARVHPGVVLDTEHGPVTIDAGAEIFPFSRLEGPCYIGPGTLITGSAKIREGTSIGPVCRVGGEVEESIIQGYSNKYHDGFLGHAFVGEWVNLGAFTTNSDLKNDYGSVTVYLQGKPVDTGSTKVGSFIGDHTKTGIGTLLNTGTVLGVMCNVVGSGSLPPKYVPSFCWFIEGKFLKYSLNAQLETARLAMSRRKVELSPEMETLIRQTHELTREERLKAVRRTAG